jgi:hypothetical protein
LNKDYQKQFYADDELEFWLDECYFHPSRDKEYPTSAIKRLAKCAMQLLWDTERLNLFGVSYDNQDIRKIMIEEMMPEDIDMAVSVFGDYKKTLSSLAQLAFMIFFLIVNRDKIVDEWFRRSYFQPVEEEKYLLPLSFRRRHIITCRRRAE